jgi:hypothetical protein
VYQEGAVPRGKGDDIGAGDDAWANELDVGLDLVDDLVTADGVDVGAGALLADEAAGVVQENRGVAALMTTPKTTSQHMHTYDSDSGLPSCYQQHVYLDEAVVEEEPDE